MNTPAEDAPIIDRVYTGFRAATSTATITAATTRMRLAARRMKRAIRSDDEG